MMAARLEPQTASPPRADVEAARYALVRRLAPSMRHHLVVNLQPIGMIYEVMDRRLRASVPDLVSVQDSANKINGFARAALASSLDVIGWLAPDDTAVAGAAQTARECAGLLSTSLSFRGYALRNEVADIPGTVRRAALRQLLSAALIHLTDKRPPPADIVLAADALAEGLLLVLRVARADREQGFVAEPPYRAIEWEDVEALAAAEGVLAQQEGDGLRLLVPWASAP
jgi:hypothetical protein